MMDEYKHKNILGIVEKKSNRFRIDPNDRRLNINGLILSYIGITFLYLRTNTRRCDKVYAEIYKCKNTHTNKNKYDPPSICTCTIIRRLTDGYYKIEGKHDPRCNKHIPIIPPPPPLQISLPILPHIDTILGTAVKFNNLYNLIITYEVLANEANEHIINYNKLLSNLNKEKIIIETIKKTTAGIKRKINDNYENNIYRMLNKKRKLI